MLKKVFTTIFIVLAFSTFVFSQGKVKGRVIEKGNKEPIPNAVVWAYADGKLFGKTQSNFDGEFIISPLYPNTYTIIAFAMGQDTARYEIQIKGDRIISLDIEMEPKSLLVKEIIITKQKNLIEADETAQGVNFSDKDIQKMPTQSVAAVAATAGGVFSDENGNVGSFRGQRAEGTITYVDGIPLKGPGVNKKAIQEIEVVTGGLAAQYGDATGGIISITTKGPSSNFGGGVSILTTAPFDLFKKENFKLNYHEIDFSATGPLLMSKKNKEGQRSPIIGYFVSGSYNYSKDGNPFPIPFYKVKDDVLERIEKNPLRQTASGGNFREGEFVKMTDLEEIGAKLNAASSGINVSGKFDIRTSKTGNSNLVFGGRYSYGYGYGYSFGSSLFNYKNNGYGDNTSWAVYGRFVQRFPDKSSSDSKKDKLIKNVFYTIQLDFSNSTSKSQSPIHKDKIFNYGYLGKYTTYRQKTYELGSDTILNKNNVWIHNSYEDTLFAFERSETNPILANYTSQYYGQHAINSGFYKNSVTVQMNKGLLNGEGPESIYGIWSNVGAPASGYSYSNSISYGLNANASAEVRGHEIKFGFQYSQSKSGGYSYNPVGLWTLMRQLANKHIIQLDKTNPHAIYDANGVFQDTIWYDRKYDASSQAFFDRNLRIKLDKPIEGLEWIDVDNLSPDTYSIDMFSADELLNSGRPYASWSGYDYKGNKLTTKPTFDDFFTAKDEYGNYKREVGFFEPIYMAGYIQDKFEFNKEIIFNVGLRVDRFDANQKVLKDPYSLYEIKTVKEVTDLGKHPSTVGQDYAVYVDDMKNPTKVIGYRNGAKWYNSEGVEIVDPTSLQTTSNRVIPYLVDPEQKTINSKTFKDYEPQVTYMPRVSFSFPVSDEANFFAHYDILSKRPSAGLIQFDPRDYLFIETSGLSTIPNPGLKPEKTIDYELGFQQKIGKASALKLSAYYREFRNQAQAVRMTEAYPVTYLTFGNIDFGTAKGFTISYDLRRTGNIWLKASYTLQFADGTGSSATSGLSLVAAGQPNLRTLSPLSFDRRHMISTVVDYRYTSGKDYNGPRIAFKGKNYNILENTGINFTFKGGSGVPYSKQANITSALGLGGRSPILQGSINGARLPWQFSVDARIDKDFSVKVAGKELMMNVYLQILNVLNTKNIMSVYRATGVPDDDGFLSAAEFQSQINTQADVEAFRQQYALAINSPGNYSLPRRIRLGIEIGF